MSKKWIYNAIFIVVGVVILAVLLKAPPVSTKRTPDDAVHAKRKEYAACPPCHLAGGEGPTVSADHLTIQGTLKGDHVKCYMCHLEPEKK
jgi:hypothetical protein